MAGGVGGIERVILGGGRSKLRCADIAPGLRFEVKGLGLRIWSLRVEGSGCRFQSLGFRVYGSGLRAEESGFRDQGTGFRETGLAEN